MNAMAVLLLVAEEAVRQVSTPFDYLAPIASTGIVGIFFLMILFRIKIMPTYVHEDAKKEWERERAASEANWDRERKQYQSDISELKATVRESTTVYTDKVIPTLTRVLDSEQELVAIRRAEQARREGSR